MKLPWTLINLSETVETEKLLCRSSHKLLCLELSGECGELICLLTNTGNLYNSTLVRLYDIYKDVLSGGHIEHKLFFRREIVEN